MTSTATWSGGSSPALTADPPASAGDGGSRGRD